MLYRHGPETIASVDNQDFNEWKLVLPREMRRDAIRECHNLPKAGHHGVDKTCERLANQYDWSAMFEDVMTYISSCHECQRCQVQQQAPIGQMEPRAIEKPWSRISADIMGPFTRSKAGHQYILIIHEKGLLLLE